MFRAGSASRAATASSTVPPGDDLVGHRAHLGFEPGQFLEAPGVRLVQVDLGAQEVLGGERVPVPADGLLLCGRAAPSRCRRNVANSLVAAAAAVRSRGQLRAKCLGHAVGRDHPLDEAGVEVVAVLVGPDVALLGDLEHLVPGRDVTGLGRLPDGDLILLERDRDGGEPGGDVLRRAIAFQRHQVEDAPHIVQPAGDHVHLAGGLASVVARHRQPETFLHRLLDHSLLLVGRRDGVEFGHRPPVEFGLGGVPLRREVGHLVVVTRDADVGGAERAERSPLFDVLVCDVIDTSHEPRHYVRCPVPPVALHTPT